MKQQELGLVLWPAAVVRGLLSLSAGSLSRQLSIAVVLIVLTRTASLAVPGDLDRRFGGFGTDGLLHATGIRPHGAALDHEGRLVLVGDDGRRFGRFLIERRSGPHFLSEELREPIMNGEARAVAITPDDKIVVAGNVIPPRSLSGNDIVVARLNPDFSLDTT